MLDEVKQSQSGYSRKDVLDEVKSMDCRGRGLKKCKRKEGVKQGNRVHNGMRDYVQIGGSGDEESRNEEETGLEPVITQGSMMWKGVRKK